MTLRLGAVSFLNARPLVWGLERDARFAVRYDLPSRCAELLHAGQIDVGLIPSIEYLAGDYRIVPGLGIVSDGPVLSVALFTRVPVGRVRTIALDTSSRTSAALVRILCVHRFGIAPAFVAAAPDLAAMTGAADAALLIGDPALFADHERLGLEKIDLGVAWKELTGLPFVYAFWAGRPGAAAREAVAGLQAARDAGRAHIDDIARAEFPGDATRRDTAAVYLHDFVRHDLGPRERAGLERFYELAAAVGAAPAAKRLREYDGEGGPRLNDDAADPCYREG